MIMRSFKRNIDLAKINKTVIDIYQLIEALLMSSKIEMPCKDQSFLIKIKIINKPLHLMENHQSLINKQKYAILVL